MTAVKPTKIRPKTRLDRLLVERGFADSRQKAQALILAGQVQTLVDFVSVDVSFISSTLILPALTPMLKNEAEALVLVKPQFEVGRDQVGKGGIVRDTRLHREAITKVSHKLLAVGFSDLGF